MIVWLACAPACAGLAAEIRLGSAAAASGDVSECARAAAVAAGAELGICPVGAGFAGTGVGGFGTGVEDPDVSPLAIGAPISPLMIVAAATADHASREPCMKHTSCVGGKSFGDLPINFCNWRFANEMNTRNNQAQLRPMPAFAQIKIRLSGVARRPSRRRYSRLIITASDPPATESGIADTADNMRH